MSSWVKVVHLFHYTIPCRMTTQNWYAEQLLIEVKVGRRYELRWVLNDVARVLLVDACTGLQCLLGEVLRCIHLRFNVFYTKHDNVNLLVCLKV